MKAADLLPELMKCSLAAQANHSPDELEALCEIFAEALADEGVELCEIEAAFRLHRKRSPYFPAPAHIVALLPECRRRPAQAGLPQGKPQRRLTQHRLRYEAWKRIRGESRNYTELAGPAVEEAMQKILAGLQC